VILDTKRTERKRQTERDTERERNREERWREETAELDKTREKRSFAWTLVSQSLENNL